MVSLLLMSLVVLLVIGAVALNLTWLVSHQAQLRQACVAGALAGAAKLLDPAPGNTSPDSNSAAANRISTATTQAQTFFAANSPAILQTTGADPDVVAGWLDDPTLPHGQLTPWPGAGPVNTLFVRGMRRRSAGQSVMLWFGNLLGMTDAEPAAAAAASLDQRIFGFRPTEVVSVPMMPLMVLSSSPWPSSVPGTPAELQDDYTVDPQTGAVSSGPDGVAEITLQVPVAAGSLPSGDVNAAWLALSPGATDFATLAQQVSQGIDSSDLAAIDGEIALNEAGTLLLTAAPAFDSTQAAALQTELLAIRGQKRIWPIGNLITEGDQQSCQVIGFVAGSVVDCNLDADSLTIVVQACTIQTCTGLLRSGTARNPWIGKLILNE